MGWLSYMRAKKGVLKGWHRGTHAHHISPLRGTRKFTTWEGTTVKSWTGGGIRLDAGNMGGGESVVGIVSEQGHDGSDGTHYGERAESLGASGVDVRLVGFES